MGARAAALASVHVRIWHRYNCECRLPCCLPSVSFQEQQKGTDMKTILVLIHDDAGQEARVQAALDEVDQGRTTFVIAHRLSTIRNATRILVFDNGRVIENGTFDELVAKGGRFAELAKAQFMVQESARASMQQPSTAEAAVKA